MEQERPFIRIIKPIYNSEQKYSNGSPIQLCCLCLFKHKRKKPHMDNRLTVINGMMVCVDHVSFAVSGPKALVNWLADTSDL